MLTGCREYRKGLIDLARGTVSVEDRRELVAHLDGCADCARLLDDQLALSAALENLAGAPLPEMATIEARVMAEFDGLASRRAWRWGIVSGIAAALCFGVIMMDHRGPAMLPQRTAVVEQAPLTIPAVAPPEVSPIKQISQKTTRKQSVDSDQPFIEIPYTVPLAPEERTTVVRMQVPVSALIAIGFDMSDYDPGATVLVDVLVSQDGRARAIRLVRSK